MLRALRQWEVATFIRCRREGLPRPSAWITARYNSGLEATLARLVLGQEPGASMHERRLAAEGVVRHAELFAPLAVEAARDLLGP